MSHSFQNSRRAVWKYLWAGVLLLVALSCSKEDDFTGGETHFLKLCDAESSTCGEDLTCMCGVCTLSCEQDSACSAYPGGVCRPAQEDGCAESEASNLCERTCSSDDACLPLSPQHRCLDGVCRLTEATNEPCDEEPVAANELVIIGDSFLATSHQITGYLEDLARAAGALTTGERYRDLSRLTGNTLSLSGRGVQAQYEAARDEAPAKIVLMNGGGADVLLGSCDDPTPMCPLIVDAAAALDDLLTQMNEDGVQQVVFIGYPDPEPEAVLERMNLLRPLLEDSCSNAPLPCHWVDLRPTFEGNYDEYVESGGLNPTTQGSQAAAEAIWSTMQQQCIAQ